MIVEGDHVSVTRNYGFQFPDGEKINGDHAEIWKAKNEKLVSLTIFFDTQIFEANYYT